MANTLNFGTDYVPTGMYDLNAFPTNSFVVKYKDPLSGNYGKAAVTATVSGSTTTYTITVGTTTYTLNGYNTKLGNYYALKTAYDCLFDWNGGYPGAATASAPMWNGAQTSDYGNNLANTYPYYISSILAQPTPVTSMTNVLYPPQTTLKAIGTDFYPIVYDPNGAFTINVDPTKAAANPAIVGSTADIWTTPQATSGSVPVLSTDYVSTAVQSLLFNGETVYFLDSTLMSGINTAGNSRYGNCFYFYNFQANLSTISKRWYQTLEQINQTPTDVAHSWNNPYGTQGIGITPYMPNRLGFLYSCYGLCCRQVIGLISLNYPTSTTIGSYAIVEDPHCGQFIIQGAYDYMGRPLRVNIIVPHYAMQKNVNGTVYSSVNYHTPVDLSQINLSYLNTLGLQPIVPNPQNLYMGTDYVPTAMYDLSTMPNNSFVVKYKNPSTGVISKAPILSSTTNGVTTYGIYQNGDAYNLIGYQPCYSNYYVTGPSNPFSIALKCDLNNKYTKKCIKYDKSDYSNTITNLTAVLNQPTLVTSSDVNFPPTGTLPAMNSNSYSAMIYDKNGAFTISVNPTLAASMPSSLMSPIDIWAAYTQSLYIPSTSTSPIATITTTSWVGSVAAQNLLYLNERVNFLNSISGVSVESTYSYPKTGVLFTSLYPLQVINSTTNLNTGTYSAPTINGVAAFGNPGNSYQPYSPESAFLHSVYGLTTQQIVGILYMTLGGSVRTLYVVDEPYTGQFSATNSLGLPVRVEIIAIHLQITSGLVGNNFMRIYTPLNLSLLTSSDLSFLAARGFRPIFMPNLADTLAIGNANTAIAAATTTINNAITSMNSSLTATQTSVTAVNSVAQLVAALNDPGVTAVVTNTSAQVTAIQGYISQTQAALSALAPQFAAAQAASPQVAATFTALQTQYQALTATVTANNSLATQAASTAASNQTMITTAVKAAAVTAGQLQSLAQAGAKAAQVTAAANQVAIYALQVQSDIFQIEYIECQFQSLPNPDPKTDSTLKSLIQNTQALLSPIQASQTTANTATTTANNAVTSVQALATTDPTFSVKATAAVSTTQSQLTAIGNIVTQAAGLATQANQNAQQAQTLLANIKNNLITPLLLTIDDAMTKINSNITQIQQSLTAAQASATAASASLATTTGLVDSTNVAATKAAADAANADVAAIQQALTQTQQQLQSLTTSYASAKTNSDVVAITSLSTSLPALATDTTNNVTTAANQATDAAQQATTASTSAQAAQNTENTTFPALLAQATAFNSQTAGYLTTANANISSIQASLEQAKAVSTTIQPFLAQSPNASSQLQTIITNIQAGLTQAQNTQQVITTANTTSGNAFNALPKVSAGADVTPNQLTAMQSGLATITQANADASQAMTTLTPLVTSATQAGSSSEQILVQAISSSISGYTNTINAGISAINSDLTQMQKALASVQNVVTAIQQALTRTDLTSNQQSALQAASTQVNQDATSISSPIASIQASLSNIQTQYSSAQTAGDVNTLSRIAQNIPDLQSTADKALTAAQAYLADANTQQGVIPPPASPSLIAKIMNFFSSILSFFTGLFGKKTS